MITLHSAFSPHVPIHGSLHLLLTQALLLSHSVLVTHSGLHPVYGSPKYSGRQEQDPAPLRSLHTAFAPQGEGLQGIRGPSVGATRSNRKKEEVLKKNYIYSIRRKKRK